MDFVVVGFGIGSICILAGLVLRDAPGWWGRLPGRGPAADDGAGAARLCRAFGNVMLVGGVVLAAVTLVALFGGLSDSAGALLVASAVTVIAIGVVGWAIRWRQRFPPPRRRLAAALAAAPLPLAVAIERGLAQEQAAVDAEADEAIEASGLTVERTVTAQERGEHPEARAEGASGGYETAERHAATSERHGADAALAAHAAEPAAANAVVDDDRLDHGTGEAAGAASDADAVMLDGDQPAGHDAMASIDDNAASPEPVAPAAGATDKLRDV